MKSYLRNPLASNWSFSILLILLVGSGIFLRFNDLSAPLLDFHPTRQLFGAIKARGLYYETISNTPNSAIFASCFHSECLDNETISNIPNWQKDLAVRQYSNEATIEPPIMETLTARLYAYWGVQTAIPRAISASFWLIGAFFLFLLTKNLSGSRVAAAIGLAFYLLLPYAVSASRAFQPDPLMIMAIIIFWWAIENWGRHQGWRWAIVAGISGGIAIFVKFPAVFFIIAPALAIILTRVGFLKAFKTPQIWVIILLGILPPAGYLYYGITLHGFLGQQFSSRFYPGLWIDPVFYLRWLLKVEIIASFPWIAAGLTGWLIFSNKQVKFFLGSLWAAYFVFGLTFAHHISSHDYYSLPLIPLLALCLAQLSVPLFQIFKSKPSQVEDQAGFALSGPAQLFCLILAGLTILIFTANQYLDHRTNDYRAQAAFWAEVGQAVNHQPGVISITTDYGYPLAYYGWQNTSLWPASVDIQNFDKTYQQLLSNKDYFLVTDFDEFNRQPELQKRLSENFPILVQNRTYLVFDLAHPKK